MEIPQILLENREFRAEIREFRAEIREFRAEMWEFWAGNVGIPGRNAGILGGDLGDFFLGIRGPWGIVGDLGNFWEFWVEFFRGFLTGGAPGSGIRESSQSRWKKRHEMAGIVT